MLPVKIGHKMKNRQHILIKPCPFSGQHIVRRQNIINQKWRPANNKEYNNSDQHADDLFNHFRILFAVFHSNFLTFGQIEAFNVVLAVTISMIGQPFSLTKGWVLFYTFHSVDLRLSAGHHVSFLHHVPYFPTDEGVSKRHYTGWAQQDQN